MTQNGNVQHYQVEKLKIEIHPTREAARRRRSPVRGEFADGAGKNERRVRSDLRDWRLATRYPAGAHANFRAAMGTGSWLPHG